MIGEMRTEALVKALGREGLTSETLVGLLVLALAADNVSIRTHEYAPIQSIVSVIAEGGKLTSDTALIHTTAIKVLQTVLNCRLAYGVGSGLAARIAGEAIGADVDLPHMGTEEFLSCLSRAALEAEASRHRVLPRGRVKDTRAALIEQVRESRLVLPAAQFALTEQESSDFAKKGSRYAYGEDSDEDPAADNEAGGDGGETVDPSIAPDDADVDQEEEDETADRFASPEDAKLEEDGGDLDDIAPPQIDAVDRADAAYDARVVAKEPCAAAGPRGSPDCGAPAIPRRDLRWRRDHPRRPPPLPLSAERPSGRPRSHGTSSVRRPAAPASAVRSAGLRRTRSRLLVLPSRAAAPPAPFPWSVPMRHVAFADRAGVIRFGKRCPRRAPPIGRHRRFNSPHGAVSAAARLAHDNEDLPCPRRARSQVRRRRPRGRRRLRQGRRDPARGARVMTPPDLTRRLAARKLAAARLATDLILDCERAASGRNGKRADPARWTRNRLALLSSRRRAIARRLRGSRRSTTRSATSRPPFAPVDAEPPRRRCRSVAPIPNS